MADSGAEAVGVVTSTEVPVLTEAELRLEMRLAETLRRVSAELVSDLDLQRVLQHVTDAATELIGADFGSFFYNVAASPNDESYVLYALSGAPREAFSGLPMPSNPEIFDPTFKGEAVLRLDDVTEAAPYGRNPPYHGMPLGHLPVRSYLAVPVISRTGEVLGGLFFGHARSGMFTAHHERVVIGITAPAAIAIDNARLFQAAEQGRQAAQRLADRLSQLQAVSAALAGAKVVDEVAHVIVTTAAGATGSDRAALYLVEQEGAVLRLARSVGYSGQWAERWGSISRRDAVPVSEALRDRRMVLVTGHEEWSDVSVAAIPLALGRQDFGVAAFGWDDEHEFGTDERQFLEALGNQCSQALERARLYENERETAHLLQASLLPPRAPEIPGMEVAAVFRAGDRSVAVGGDFYDVFRLGPDRWGLAMGDVCGRGARAAAQTALVRYTLRAVAGGSDNPVAALDRLNQVMLAEDEAEDRFCATLFAHLDVDGDGARVTLACAGHPRPVVIRRAGWIDLRGQPGSLIGVLDHLDVTEDRVRLGPGDALIAFTDGITEARNAAGEQFSDEALQEALLACTDHSAAQVAHDIRSAALAFAGGTLNDDLAILVVRVPPEPDDDEADGHGVQATGVSPRQRPLPPREARIALPPEPTSPRAARRFLASLLVSWRMPEMLEGEAALLLSELATNAIQHARSPFTVIVRYDGTFIRIEVGDGSQEVPRLEGEEQLVRRAGRGLVLVDSIAHRWGIHPTARGKRVWFDLPVRP